MSYMSFDSELAEKVGVESAVLLQGIMWWTQQNETNGRNCHDGHYWTYNSAKAFALQYSFLSPSQISKRLKALEEGGWILTGNYNPTPYDRTKWYTVGPTLEPYYQIHFAKRQMESPKRQNVVKDLTVNYQLETNEKLNPTLRAKVGEAPSPKAENDDEKSERPEPSSVAEERDVVKKVVADLNERAGRRFKATGAAASYIRARMREGAVLEDFLEVNRKKVAEWGGDEKMSKYLQPSTLYSSKHFDEYLNAPDPTGAVLRPVYGGAGGSAQDGMNYSQRLAAMGQRKLAYTFCEEDGFWYDSDGFRWDEIPEGTEAPENSPEDAPGKLF